MNVTTLNWRIPQQLFERSYPHTSHKSCTQALYPWYTQCRSGKATEGQGDYHMPTEWYASRTC